MAPTNNSGLDHMEMKKMRRERPSSWLELTDNQTLPLVIDALLDSPPGREFNKKELGNHAGVSRESVRKYIGILVKFNIVTEIPDTEPQRYRLNSKGKATRELFELKSALNAEGSEDDAKIEEPETEMDEQLLTLDLARDREEELSCQLESALSSS